MMERESILASLLESTCIEGEHLKSPEFKQYKRSTEILAILLRDHLKVFDGQIYHHGNCIRIRDDVATVLVNSQEKGANGK